MRKKQSESNVKILGKKGALSKNVHIADMFYKSIRRIKRDYSAAALNVSTSTEYLKVSGCKLSTPISDLRRNYENLSPITTRTKSEYLHAAKKSEIGLVISRIQTKSPELRSQFIQPSNSRIPIDISSIRSNLSILPCIKHSPSMKLTPKSITQDT